MVNHLLLVIVLAYTFLYIYFIFCVHVFLLFKNHRESQNNDYNHKKLQVNQKELQKAAKLHHNYMYKANKNLKKTANYKMKDHFLK